MARLSKCKGCNKELQTNEKHMYANKCYCENCYNGKILEKKDYENLLSYICNCFDTERPNGLILKQIKDYKENFNYTYGGIHYCLWYLTEVKCVRLDIKYGIGLVKFEYENAKDYFTQQQNIKNSVQKHKDVEVVKTIKLKNRNGASDKFLINIDDLISEGD